MQQREMMMMMISVTRMMMIMMIMKVLSQVIAAEGEQKASRALKEAAAVINESPSALQVDHHGDGDDGGE